MNSFGHKETCKLVMFWNAINTISSKDEGINVFCDKDNISNVQSYQSIQIEFHDYIDFKYLLLINYFILTEFLIFNVIRA